LSVSMSCCATVYDMICLLQGPEAKVSMERSRAVVLILAQKE
jgi:hypothetical protein